MNPSSSGQLESVAGIETSEYLRQRLEPQIGDRLYLHLSDLRLALEQLGPFPERRVLDYGCGGSPYRPLFQASTYHRADITGTPDIDYPFGADSRISAPSAGYEGLLSTQVLEHVRDYSVYLAECRRLLVPGGRLILSTHGVFPDHGCPYDFRRWTADGLRTDLETAGFTVTRVLKLTTGPRAMAFLNQYHQPLMLTGRKSPVALGWRFSTLLYRLSHCRLNRFLDLEYKGNRVVSAEVPGHDFYIALLVEARAPRPPGAPA